MLASKLGNQFDSLAAARLAFTRASHPYTVL